MKRRCWVVGAGPAGLVAAITLLSTLSRAMVISTRNMEIFRSWGLEDAGEGSRTTGST